MILKNMKIVLCKKGDSDFSLSRRPLSLLGSSCSDFHDFLWGNQKQFEMTRHEKKEHFIQKHFDSTTIGVIGND